MTTTQALQPTDSIDVLGLPTRLRNTLIRERIWTIADLTDCTARDILDLRNIGMGTLGELIAALERHGLALSDRVD
jgi:DNA-directed RNA polymerase alpha subunit